MKSITLSILIGAALILFGISIIVKVLFGIDIHLFKTFCAALLIYWGVRLIIQPKDVQFGSCKTYIYTTRSATQEKLNKEYSIAFGSGKIDLTHIQEADTPVSIQVNVSFGQATILLDKNMPAEISIQSTFSNVQVPEEEHDLNTVETYYTHPDKEAKIHLVVQAHFAQVTIVKT